MKPRGNRGREKLGRRRAVCVAAAPARLPQHGIIDPPKANVAAGQRASGVQTLAARHGTGMLS